MPYGFDLEEPLRSQLRGALPAEARAWVERVTRTPVVGELPLEGGRAAATHLLRMRTGAQLVLQRFVLDWIHDEPWVPSVEVAALETVADSDVPAPILVAADPAGHEADAPAVLMTALDGAVVWDPPDLDPWLDGIVTMLQRIHAVDPGTRLGTWAAYAPVGVPQWTAHPRAWATAIEVFESPRPEHDRVLVHRDLHPGNLLWSGDAITGVVDWTATCIGPPEEDVAHCRANLAMHLGMPMADALLERWLAATGRADYDPRWDLLTAVSMPEATPDAGLDAFVAAAAARLG